MIRRISLAAVIVGIAAAATGSAIVLATGSDDPPAQPAPTETVSTPTRVPTATPTFSPPTPPPGPPLLTEPRPYPEAVLSGFEPLAPPGLPVDADPVRVYTGDGDCLNVRPQPGLSFDAAPFSCVPEGTLLWLTGTPVDADGETWRYALGAGWIAIRYSVAAERPDVALPGETVTVWNIGAYRDLKSASGSTLSGSDIYVARVDLATGEVVRGVIFGAYGGGGLGGSNPTISPSGRYIAYGSWNPLNGQSLMVVGDIENGTAMQVPGYPDAWNADDQVITTIQQCGTSCTSALAVYDARSGKLTTLKEQFTGYPIGWSNDGSKVMALDDARTFLEIGLDGTERSTGQVPEGTNLWDAESSPRGDILLSTGGLDAMQLTDADTLTLQKVARAPQRELPGKCGGTWSQSIGWLDETTFYYHERSSSNGKDGITVARTSGETLAVFPFFNAQDLVSPMPGKLTFASWSASENPAGNTVTFVLDVATGDFVPVVTGAGAVWE